MKPVRRLLIVLISLCIWFFVYLCNPKQTYTRSGKEERGIVTSRDLSSFRLLSKGKHCSDSPHVLRTCTNCKFRNVPLRSCAADTSFGMDDTGADQCSVSAPECQYTVKGGVELTLATLIDMAYVVSFEPDPLLIHKLGEILEPHKVKVFPAVRGLVNGKKKALSRSRLTNGESGYMSSMLAVIQDALISSHRTVMIFDDDALLVRDFDRKVKQLLRTDSCSCFLEPNSGCPAGVLMLGGTVIGNQAIFDAWATEIEEQQRGCVNYIRGTWGSFANVYNTQLFPDILDWIASEGKELPYDALYSFLTLRGHVVRVAYPFMSMALMNETSSVQSESKQNRFKNPEARAKWYYEKNHWNVDDFY